MMNIQTISENVYNIIEAKEQLLATYPEQTVFGDYFRVKGIRTMLEQARRDMAELQRILEDVEEILES
jgi:nucleoside-triphosphatase THEP1